MKKVLSVIAEFVLFLLLNVIGGVFYHPFHIETQLASGSRSFVWDGVIFMLAAWLLLLLVSILRKKLLLFAPQLTIALILSALAGFFLKIGFVTHNW